MQTLKNIGFGYVEVGSVTPLQQNGQIKPRLFRLSENEAIINRLDLKKNNKRRGCKRAPVLYFSLFVS